jgi:hypothetical protein
LLAGATWTVRRRRIAMWPRAEARWVLPTPASPRMRAACGPWRNRRLVSLFQSCRS